jgi:hypothetical protein
MDLNDSAGMESKPSMISEMLSFGRFQNRDFVVVRLEGGVEG